MTCTTCGTTLERTDTVCPVCSTPVAPTEDPATYAPTENPADAPTEDPAMHGPTEDPATHGPTYGPTDAPRYGPADAPRYGPPALGAGRPATGSPAPPAGPSGLDSEVRGWGIAAHLLGLGGALATVVTLGFLGPLLVWVLKREEHPFIDHHAKEALNFQLTTLVAVVAGVIAAIPVFLLGFLTLGVLWLVAGAVVLAASVVWFVFPIMGAVRASNGEGYRYPVSIRFVR